MTNILEKIIPGIICYKTGSNEKYSYIDLYLKEKILFLIIKKIGLKYNHTCVKSFYDYIYYGIQQSYNNDLKKVQDYLRKPISRKVET